MDLLTADELAAKLRKSTETVYRMARAGDLPHMKVGREYRFDWARVQAALEAPPAGWEQSRRSTGRRRAA